MIRPIDNNYKLVMSRWVTTERTLAWHHRRWVVAFPLGIGFPSRSRLRRRAMAVLPTGSSRKRPGLPCLERKTFKTVERRGRLSTRSPSWCLKTLFTWTAFLHGKVVFFLRVWQRSGGAGFCRCVL